jgi:hypothetical protein
MEALCSSETSVATQRTTRRHIPEDGTLHINYSTRSGNSSLKCDISFLGIKGLPHTRRYADTEGEKVRTESVSSILKLFIYRQRKQAPLFSRLIAQ